MSRVTRERSLRRPQPPPITERRKLGAPVTPLIELPDASSLGPAMAALSPAELGFVIAKTEYGLSDAAAAEAAGYSARSPNSLAVQGSVLRHRPRVMEALLEAGKQLLRREGAKSIRTLVAIRDDETAPVKDRRAAATALLDRGGYHLVQEVHQHQHNDSRTDAEKDQRILELLGELGISRAEAEKALIAPKMNLTRQEDGTYGAREPMPAGPVVAEPVERKTPREHRRDEQRQRARDEHEAQQDRRIKELAAKLGLTDADLARMVEASQSGL